jgi:serine/threonine protein phosphatase PrpC
MQEELRITVGALTDVGQVRDHNEDALRYHQPREREVLAQKGRLYLVADGMGGHVAGEVASQCVVRTVLASYYESHTQAVRQALGEAIQQANADLYGDTSGEESRRKMATTLVGAVVLGRQLQVANIGDSRAYLLRGDAIRQLTEDHSFVTELIKRGRISEEEAASHPQRNVVTRALGTKPTVEADFYEETIQPGDTVILCTDGLWGEVSEEEMVQMANRSPHPQEVASELVALANQRGGPDNITVIILQIGKPSPLAHLLDQ